MDSSVIVAIIFGVVGVGLTLCMAVVGFFVRSILKTIEDNELKRYEADKEHFRAADETRNRVTYLEGFKDGFFAGEARKAA